MGSHLAKISPLGLKNYILLKCSALLGMTDIPELTLSQIQQRVVAMWMGSFYGSSGYVARRLGKRGLREFQELGAKQVAATFKRIGLDKPMDVAMAIATNDKNLFGSEVSVIEGDDGIEIRRSRCGLLEGAQSFSRIGASLVAKEHCKTCMESHWKRVFSDLGLKMAGELTEDGCLMRISE
jgi:hypothetical protein